jgi:hypothetical protein
MKGKTGVVLQNIKYDNEVIVEEKKPNPLMNYIKHSSLFIFHKKSAIRKSIFKVVIDPDFDYPDDEVKKVEFDELNEETQEDLLNQGFRKDIHYLHKSSTFFTNKYQAKEINAI